MKDLPPQIDSIVLLDRPLDFLTPLSTQLTYEGLIDEIYQIKNGEVGGGGGGGGAMVRRCGSL